MSFFIGFSPLAFSRITYSRVGFPWLSWVMGSLDPYSMKILKLCYIIWSTCSSLQSGQKKVELPKNQALASPWRISHPEGHFLQGLVNAVKSLIREKWFMLLKYPLCVVVISSPELVRTQWNDRDVDQRKIQKELLSGGFRSQESVFRKGLNKEYNNMVGPTFSLAKLLPWFLKEGFMKR